MVKKINLFFLFLLIFAVKINAQNISAKAFTDSTDYKVGDYINLTIQIEHQKNINISAPVVKDTLSKYELIKSEPSFSEESRGGLLTTFKYIISKYDSGTVNIDGIPILYQTEGSDDLQTAYTNPLSFTVHTLPVNPKAGIKDIKEPIKIPLDWELILIWLLAALIIIVILFYLYRKYFKKKKSLPVEKKVLMRPPHVIALYSLRALEEKQLWQKGKIKEYHSEITEIIRKYFHEQFLLSALELTTSEVMDNLKSVGDAKPILDTTYKFLTNADLVKFAKFLPMDSVNEEMMAQAKEIVEKTKPKVQKEIVHEDEDV